VTPVLFDGYVREYLSLSKRLIHDVFSVEHLIEFPFERLDSEF